MFVPNNLPDPRIDQLSTKEKNRFLWDRWRNQLEYACTSKTPAEAAGAKCPYRSWQEVMAKRKVITPAKVSATSTTVIPELSPRPPIVVRRRFGKFHRHGEKPMPALVAIRG
jgi:hypothetical protein